MWQIKISKGYIDIIFHFEVLEEATKFLYDAVNHVSVEAKIELTYKKKVGEECKN